MNFDWPSLLTSLDFWAIVISFIALFFSGWSWWLSHNLDRARRKDEIRDANSAQIRVRLEEESKKFTVFLVVENKGRAEARGIQVYLDRTPIESHKSFDRGPKPRPTIGPQSDIKYRMSFFSDIPFPNDVTVKWIDDNLIENTYETTLSFTNAFAGGPNIL